MDWLLYYSCYEKHRSSTETLRKEVNNALR